MLPANHGAIAGEVAKQDGAPFAAPATLRRMFQYVEAWGVFNEV